MNLTIDPDIELPSLTESRIPKAYLVLESEIFPRMVIDTLDEVHIDEESWRKPHTVMINYNRETVKAHRRYFERNAKNELCTQKWLRRIFTFNSNEVPYYSALVLKMEHEECYYICCDEVLLLPSDVRESLKSLQPIQSSVPKIPSLCQELVVDSIVKSLERAVGLFQAWEQKLGIKMKVGYFIPQESELVTNSSSKQKLAGQDLKASLEANCPVQIEQFGTSTCEMETKFQHDSVLSQNGLQVEEKVLVEQEVENKGLKIFQEQEGDGDTDGEAKIDGIGPMKAKESKSSSKTSFRALRWLKSHLMPCICIPAMPMIEENEEIGSECSKNNIEVTAQLELNGPSQVVILQLPQDSSATTTSGHISLQCSRGAEIRREAEVNQEAQKATSAHHVGMGVGEETYITTSDPLLQSRQVTEAEQNFHMESQREVKANSVTTDEETNNLSDGKHQSQSLPVIGKDVEPVKGLIVQLTLQGKSGLDERLLQLSGNGVGVLTRIMNDGKVCAVRWECKPLEEHYYRTGRWGKFELELAEPSPDEDKASAILMKSQRVNQAMRPLAKSLMNNSSTYINMQPTSLWSNAGKIDYSLGSLDHKQHANFHEDCANVAPDWKLSVGANALEEKIGGDAQRQVWDDSSFLEVLANRQKEFQELERKQVGHIISEAQMINLNSDEANPTAIAPSYSETTSHALPERSDQIRMRHKLQGNFIYFNNGGAELDGKNVGRLQEMRTKRSMEVKSSGRQATPRPLDREWLQTHSLKSHPAIADEIQILNRLRGQPYKTIPSFTVLFFSP
mmetsp:Transcript_34976/g.79127  ORF Transcript_34976/g.79127 Transcript_34976/m.79127 type:complete len:792 (+) Transcript_34976:94-2469(+)